MLQGDSVTHFPSGPHLQPSLSAESLAADCLALALRDSVDWLRGASSGWTFDGPTSLRPCRYRCARCATLSDPPPYTVSRGAVEAVRLR